MSVHQYIGARYVPYYYENSLDPTSTDWEPNVTYEALTVVTLPNQHSYISKKTVPDTIGSPALNAAYWLDTGSDNAYIQDLQDQIDAIVNTDIPGLQSDIADVQASVDDLAADKRRIVVIGDSYMLHGSYPWDTVLKGLFDCSNDDFFSWGEGSTGFEHVGNDGHTFETLLSAHISDITDKDTITDIFVGGGTNDFYYFTTAANLANAMDSFISYAKAQLPNARIWFCFMGYYTLMEASMFTDYVKTKQLYASKGIANGVFFIDAGRPMKCYSYRLDSQHPNDNGSKLIAQTIYNAVHSAGTFVYDSHNATIVFDSDITASSGNNYITHTVTGEGSELMIWRESHVINPKTLSTMPALVRLGQWNSVDLQCINSNSLRIPVDLCVTYNDNTISYVTAAFFMQTSGVYTEMYIRIYDELARNKTIKGFSWDDVCVQLPTDSY